MPYSEAQEHIPGRLHVLFVEPYSAFGNEVMERQLHLVIALRALLEAPLRQGRLRMRVIHGWENGNSDPGELRHSEHAVTTLGDIREISDRYRQAARQGSALPHDAGSLLAEPRDAAIDDARATGQEIDTTTRDNPAHWPEFARGLTLYTFFKVYHRLTYGEDETYRSIRCETPDGPREIHEFHLEEGEFAIVTPTEDATPATTVLMLHVSQLGPVLELLENCLEAARRLGFVH